VAATKRGLDLSSRVSQGKGKKNSDPVNHNFSVGGQKKKKKKGKFPLDCGSQRKGSDLRKCIVGKKKKTNKKVGTNENHNIS